MTVTLVKSPWTPREQQFLDDVELFRARGGTHEAVVAMMNAVSSPDVAGALQLLLDVAVNPVDRELFEVGLSIIRGGAQ